MTVGEPQAVPGCSDLYYVDTGMYDVEGYGAVYVLDAERPAVVDAGIGTNYGELRDALAELGIGESALEYVLPTHVHLDHAGGAGFFARDYPNATVLTHERGVRHLVDPSRLVEGTKSAVGDQWEHYVEPEPVPEDRIEGLTDGDEVDLGDRRLSAVHAPGHAPHQVVFHDSGDDVLFTADAAGLYLPGADEIHETSPPPQFDLDQALRDVETLIQRDPDHLCFPHFGPRAFDADLLANYKRRLVEWVEAVRQKRAELDDDEAVVEHFVDHPDEDEVETWGERKARAERRLNTRGVLAYLDRRAEEAESVEDGE